MKTMIYCKFASILIFIIILGLLSTVANGQIQFCPAKGIDLGFLFSPNYVATGDFNNDGQDEIVVGGFQGSQITVIKSDSIDSYSIIDTIDVGGWTRAIVVGDFNEDGFPDIAVSSDGLVLLLNDSLGGFIINSHIAGVGGRICISDYDQDGHLDLAVGGSPIFVLKGDGFGNFSQVDTLSGDGNWGLASADMNNDGFIDIVSHAWNEAQPLTIFYNDGEGSFPSSQILQIDINSQGIACEDFNHDGLIDIALANQADVTPQEVIVLLNQGSGNFIQKVKEFNGYVGLEPLSSIISANFNDDKYPEMAMTLVYSNAVGILSMNSDTTFQPVSIFGTTGPNPTHVAIGDFDGDNYYDFVTADYTGHSISVFLRIPPNMPSHPLPDSGATDQGINLILSWICSRSISDTISYDVYFGTDNPPLKKIASDQPETNIIINDLDFSTTYFWQVVAKDNFGNSTRGPVWNFITMLSVTVQIPVDSGWNMISLPVDITNSKKDTLFQSSISDAFRYDSHYFSEDLLKNGVGYWLKFPAFDLIPLIGIPIREDTISVLEGWNLIGSISYPISVSSITSIPSGIITSQFFGYEGSYSSVDSIKPGKGYWVKVMEDGFLTIGNPTLGTCDDTINYEGKTYNTVQIGDQCWLKENLVVGTIILGTDTSKDNSVIEKYCYNDSIENCNIYGGLYQWNEAMQYTATPGTRGICPEGWHIPTEAEFQTLSTSVGANSNSLKAIGQGSGSGTGTNTSGFSALLGGHRTIDGHFINIINGGFFWSTTQNGYLGMGGSDDDVGIYFGYSNQGFSVRCIKEYN